MNNKSEELYELGLIVGRFQLFHIGHKYIIDNALEYAKKIIILVGSANKKGTFINPFDVETRIKMIKETYKKEMENQRIMIYPIDDLVEHPENPENVTYVWGNYVLENVKKHTGRLPDIMFCGDEPIRDRWFPEKDRKNIKEIRLDRGYTNTTGTKARKMLALNQKEEFEKVVDKNVFEMYDFLREVILKVPEYELLSTQK